MNNRNTSDLDQLFQFVKSNTPLSHDELLTCQKTIRSIQDQSSDVLNTLDPDSLTLLMHTARKQHREVLNTLLAAKADPNIQNKYGVTALIFCASSAHDNVTIAKDLIDSGANIDLSELKWLGATALIHASRVNNRKIAKLLIEEKANINTAYDNHWQTALDIALDNNNKEIVLRLLNANAKIDFGSIDDHQILEGYLQTCKEYNRYSSIDKSFTLENFLSNSKLPPPNRSESLEDRLSAIMLSKNQKSDQGIIELQRCFMEIKECEVTPKPDINEVLILAAYYKSTPFVMELLKAGANINYMDKWGRTALIGSARSKDKTMFALLLKQGANVHLNDSGGKCLVHFCQGHPRMNDVQLLIKKGVDVNYIHDQQGYPELRGMTPLIVSIVNHNEAAFDELLKAGVDINKEDAYGRTPLYLAIDRQHRVMIQKLIDTNAGCIFSQEDLNHAKKVDSSDYSRNKSPQDSLYSFMAKLKETHPYHSVKSLLINQLDEEIGNTKLPMVLLDLIASYNNRYNHYYFFRSKENVKNKEETKPKVKSESEFREKQPLMADLPFKCSMMF